MERNTLSRFARNGGPLAPGWIQTVLGDAVQSAKKSRRWPANWRICKQVRELIFQMVVENPGWGAPRIHGELLMLGFEVSETTISCWMKRAPRNPEPAKRWRAFLRNHREVIAAMDFLTVPTLTFNVLYCFFITSRDRKRILHFNVTRHPTSS